VIEVHSYRRVFDLERRIYRVDRFRLNPAGVPVRGIVYFLALAGAALLVSAMPLLGTAVHAAPWYVRDVALPGAAATLGAVIRIEGRTCHLALLGALRFGLAPPRTRGLGPAVTPGGHWQPEQLLLLPDGSDGALRRLRYQSPGAARITIEHELGGWAVRGRSHRPPWRVFAPAVTVSERGCGRRLERGQVVVLGRGARLLVRPAKRRGYRAR
jgi:hypothetical protein